MPGDQPITGKPRDADDEAEDGSKDDAQHGNQQRIEQSDQIEPAVTIRRAVGNERLADVEAGAIVEEAEAADDPFGGKVASGIGDQFPAQPEQQHNNHCLDENAARPRIPVERDAGWARGPVVFDRGHLASKPITG